MPNSANLTPGQRRLVAAMLTARSVPEAAKTAGVSLRSARRWLQVPAVKADLSAALDVALAETARRTVAAMGGALDTLEEIHGDREQPAAARVSAAGRILETGPKLAELQDLARRLAELEERIAEAENERS